ncbi:peptidoglycan/xylan/chitin deacetylase (PgdA/CDA1 family) [Streptomyces olivoverticillatus]|uniref:Peptidoglycan/xylan/chitin deacetylase (PgdA/CDA1 family) n=1 Tax=Streptomyces olivoverticillatus TaxID=66427 RepID=A0A7W7PKP9_9ACTN|nr:polysaccharide deacetylase family protein [Streptomyces olivoverticillatus]MBB4893447.1 peptidoglycan/xylan/chitin deacetylase (PgdA/CDA1 family) [Streptomyces olivoverticillatus]
MSGYREVLRHGRGRHRRRRRTSLKAAVTVGALVAGSAFAVTAMDDPPQNCDPQPRAKAGGSARRDAGRVDPCPARAVGPAGKAGDRDGPDGTPRGEGGTGHRTPAPPEPEGVYDRERCGNTSGRILLSLDDWPYSDPDRAVRIGAQLQAKGVRAAFFLINRYASQYPQIVSTLRQQGHWVGNHTYSHRNLPGLSEDEVQDEISRGVHGNLLRPPYGDAGEREREIAADLGYRICNWTIDTHDWEKVEGAMRSADSIRTIVREATTGEKQNGVVLGHLFSNFPEALNGVIDDLHAQGYQLCRNTGPVGEQVPYPLQC